eukprot:CAMPEP_0114485830 /NCGR_PEP_ID=MMETSP0104-20121206/20155_1 /TAXON_ID=37642 ORGANISM="Paraphysomonas imperforata, Strain PA2" /NCGR_SAMPLE_ID=MMETSP0104 /ASSEMBLY_ACC=CAM_ASM_000202 /LENGTH=124 /DNA_ID=CAMNT_0001661969 /DNA_START=51 /DNA_END=426 /DNA_ORIENTATION=-
MVKTFEERGITFPVLNNPHNPKNPHEAVVDPNATPSPSVHLLAKKCKKFSSYKNLEKSLDTDHLPPLTKEERDKIRQQRKEQKRQRALKEAKKMMIIKQKSKSSVMGDGDSGDEEPLLDEIQPE